MTYNGDPSQQYSAPQRQYPQPPQPYGYNQQPQSPPYGNYQQPAAALPTIWPTLLVTLFFGLFGLIPAVMHANRAREQGRPTNNYWITFGATIVGSFIFWMHIFTSMAASTPTYYNDP
jgi:H+/Cl- antiporter ClcA